MTTAIATTLHFKLYHSRDGLAVEVTGLPTFPGAPWENQRRQLDLAAEEFAVRFPHLVIQRSTRVDSDSLIFWVERS